MDHCTIKVLCCWKTALFFFFLGSDESIAHLHCTTPQGQVQLPERGDQNILQAWTWFTEGKLAWSCHHAQRSLECTFVKKRRVRNLGGWSVICRDAAKLFCEQKAEAADPALRDDAMTGAVIGGFSRACANINQAVCFPSSLAAFKVHTGCKCHPGCLQPKWDGVLLPQEP